MVSSLSMVRGPVPGRRGATNRQTGHVPGEPGVWILLLGDLLVFALLFIAYLNRRGDNEVLFAESQGHLNQAFGIINTMILLTSSLLIVFALHTLRNERLRHLAPNLIIAGMVTGFCFVLVKAVEYYTKVSAGITGSTNQFFMYYFGFTGLHLAHVIIGLVFLAISWQLIRKDKPTSTHIAFFEGSACFWHVVDLLWIVLFPLLYLVR